MHIIKVILYTRNHNISLLKRWAHAAILSPFRRRILHSHLRLRTLSFAKDIVLITCIRPVFGWNSLIDEFVGLPLLSSFVWMSICLITRTCRSSIDGFYRLELSECFFVLFDIFIVLLSISINPFNRITTRTHIVLSLRTITYLLVVEIYLLGILNALCLVPVVVLVLHLFIVHWLLMYSSTSITTSILDHFCVLLLFSCRWYWAFVLHHISLSRIKWHQIWILAKSCQLFYLLGHLPDVLRVVKVVRIGLRDWLELHGLWELTIRVPRVFWIGVNASIV